jgi:vitamin B12 transporter
LKTALVNNREIATGNSGYGYAKGFELFYRDKKSIPHVDFWISYSYLDTKRDYLNYPQPLQPNFAARHTANLVIKKFVAPLKTMFNANYVFASGRPYYHLRYDNSGTKSTMTDGGKTIAYNSLSFSLNYLPNVFKKGAAKNTVFVFSMTNVLGSKQIYGYQYSANGLRKEAITPPARSFIFIGAFISFGVDRSDDVINNNL